MQCLSRAGAVLKRSQRVTVAEGPDQGKFAYELTGEEAEQKHLTKIVHRAAFLKELLENVPEGHMHASRKLERAERQADDSVKLYLYVSRLKLLLGPYSAAKSCFPLLTSCIAPTGLNTTAISSSARTASEASSGRLS